MTDDDLLSYIVFTNPRAIEEIQALHEDGTVSIWPVPIDFKRGDLLEPTSDISDSPILATAFL